MDSENTYLHVMMVISNPCNYKRRIKLAKEFIQRMDCTPCVKLYTVELAYKDQSFLVTDSSNPRHLQLRTEHPLWHKESLINIGVRRLLPDDWKAFAWVDADIEFKDPLWAENTLKLLNVYDAVQIFEIAHYLNPNNNVESPHRISRMKSHIDGVENVSRIWGFGCAYTRKTFETLGGMYEYGILGGGDSIMLESLLGKKTYVLYPSAFHKSIDEFRNRCKDLKVGYTPVEVLHYFHGNLADRNYAGRNSIFKKYELCLDRDITRNEDGLIVATDTFPKGLLDDIITYFYSRNEDHYPGVVKATWGAKETIDVTNIVKQWKIESLRLANGLFGGDPDVGRKKTLHVEYEDGREQTVGEYERFILLK